MQTHRYQLQPYAGPASRHRCPQCNKPRTFTCYIDTQTGQPVNNIVGKCDRIKRCGYHLPPAKFLSGNLNTDAGYAQVLKQTAPSCIAESVVAQSLLHPERNNLVMYIANYIGAVEAEQLVKRYRMGRSNHWPGATVFWQTDINGNTRTGKIMLYNKETGKRVKQPFNHVSWVHKVTQLPNYNLQQCLFGGHLLRGNYKPVAIVESEKTALIASLYYPHFIWLACGGISNLTPAMC